MNSYAFARYYNERCPVDQPFADAYGMQLTKYDDELAVMGEAETVPLPDHSSEEGGKSAVTVALQLLKRYRVIRWKGRNGRMPASVMLSCLALEVAQPGRSIAENLKEIVNHILNRLLDAKSRGKLIEVENPCCPGDIFTDRWPVNQEAQDIMIDDMGYFLRQLEVVLDENRSLKDRINTLENMFGEAVAQQVSKEFEEETGKMVREGKHGFGPKGGLPVTAGAADNSKAAPANTFYASRNLRSHKQKRVVPKPMIAQKKAMLRVWPHFQDTSTSPESAVWTGSLKGLERQFQVSVQYDMQSCNNGSFKWMMPIVRVLKPTLVPNPDAEEEAPLPHMYLNDRDGPYSPLCLFDPKANEWDPSKFIARTTIPWTVRWLACYEIWEATGRWVGGGRHDESKDE